MDESASETPLSKTQVERTSDLDMVVTRIFDAPPRIVFQAWTTPELFVRWWAPKSMGVPIRSCEMDVRTGGSYRLEFGHDVAGAFAFFGNYLDVVPNARLVWSNDEGADGAVTTVTFAEQGSKTLLTFHDRYPTKEALDEAFDIMPEQFDQLDVLLASQESGVDAP
ncbi:MAG: SRPBCC family protein [Pseudomonadota bacterium]